MSWDYSDLSHQAKQAGGPEKFVKNLETFNYNNGLKDGKSEQAIVDLAIAGIAAGGYALYKIIRKRIEKSKEPKISAEQAELSRQQLIQGIKDAEIAEPAADEVSEDEIDTEGGEKWQNVLGAAESSMCLMHVEASDIAMGRDHTTIIIPMAMCVNTVPQKKSVLIIMQVQN